MSENCVFYISPMYEFSHSLDPKETLAALALEDKADPRVDEVYVSGERQRPV